MWGLKQINTLMKMSTTDSLMMFFSQVTKLLVFIPRQRVSAFPKMLVCVTFKNRVQIRSFVL